MNRLWLIIACLFPVGLTAQDVDLDISTGVSTYFGDLSPASVGELWSEISPVVGLGLRFHPSEALFFQFGVHSTRFEVDNEVRKLHFRTAVNQATLSVGLHVFRLLLGRPTKFSPYFSIGYGVLTFNPKSQLDGQVFALQPLGTEGQGIPGYQDAYSLFAPVVPVNFGLRLEINSKLSIAGEINYHYPFTDYIDDVSNTRIDYLTLLNSNGPVAARFSNPKIDPLEPREVNYKRGGQFNDVYYFATIHLSFRLTDRLDLGSDEKKKSGPRIRQRKVKCPEF